MASTRLWEFRVCMTFGLGKRHPMHPFDGEEFRDTIFRGGICNGEESTQSQMESAIATSTNRKWSASPAETTTITMAGYSLSLTVGRGGGCGFLRREEERPCDDVYVLEGGLRKSVGSGGLDRPLGWNNQGADELLEVAPVATVEARDL